MRPKPRSEEQALEDTVQHRVIWEWLDQDQLEARFHYLPPEERRQKVEGAMASAMKKEPHPNPARRGEFVYKMFAGMRDTVMSTSRQARRTELVMDVNNDAAEVLCSSMTKDMSSKTSRSLVLEALRGR